MSTRFKAQRNRLTLLCKYIVIRTAIRYKAANPHPQREKINTSSQFFGCTTGGPGNKSPFLDHRCFLPEVRKYLASKVLPFKVLSMLGNVPGYPEPKASKCCPQTLSLIQPLDQGVIKDFEGSLHMVLYRKDCPHHQENPSRKNI